MHTRGADQPVGRAARACEDVAAEVEPHAVPALRAKPASHAAVSLEDDHIQVTQRVRRCQAGNARAADDDIGLPDGRHRGFGRSGLWKCTFRPDDGKRTASGRRRSVRQSTRMFKR
jgi:hypothetical protein